MTPQIESLLAESDNLSDSHSTATRKSYQSDWRHFVAWSAGAGLDALPALPDTVIAYLVELLHTRKIVTAARRAAAITYYHHREGVPLPVGDRVRRLLGGAQRIRCEKPLQKRAITLDELGAMCAGASIRNRSILTLGFATALRRSNLVTLDLADLEFTAEGVLVSVRREKQDQQGKGRQVGVTVGERMETCPVGALRAWIALRGDGPGPLYLPVEQGVIGHRRLHPGAIARVVKGAARKIGLDPAWYAGHSMRAGCISAALERGIDSLTVAAHTGHRSLTSLQRYYRAAPFRGQASSAMCGI